MRFADAVVMHDSVGNWKLVTEQPETITGAMHLFDLYPVPDVDLVSVTGIIPKHQMIATAFTSDGGIPVLFEEFGRGACLFAPIRFGFTADVQISGAPASRFQIHARTEPASAKAKAKRGQSAFNVMCGRDALEWMKEPDTAAA